LDRSLKGRPLFSPSDLLIAANRKGNRGLNLHPFGVPATALVDGRLRLQLQIVETGAAPCPPQTNEIQRVNIVLVPRSE
jgi:hypothetical protein